MIDREQVLHVARLARLRLSDEEVERMAARAVGVLDHIETISELDLDGVRADLARGRGRQRAARGRAARRCRAESALAAAPPSGDGLPGSEPRQA